MSTCCRESERDEDRTHSVNYTVEHCDGRVVWSDRGSEIACSHNDAIEMARMMAGRIDCSMKPRGKNGTWKGSEIVEGNGERADVWISRGPGEEDYDASRRASWIAEGWREIDGGWWPPEPLPAS